MLRRGLAVLAALALGGCAFPQQLSQVAVDHNRMVAQSTDEQTLLNIVRASYRFPLHFTAISTVNGDVSFNADASLDVSLDPRIDPQGAGLSGGIGTSPSFSANVLAGETFQRGIQDPIEADLVAYYMGEGWRDALLMALMVERVDVGARDPATGDVTWEPVPILNDPDSEVFADLLCTHNLVVGPGSSPLAFGPANRFFDPQSPSDAATTRAARLEEFSLFLDILANEQVELSDGKLQIPRTFDTRLERREQPRCARQASSRDLAGKVLRPNFRSTMGVIYFLGEYYRETADGDRDNAYDIPYCNAAGPCTGEYLARSYPLIGIRSGSGRALLATEFQGGRYYIPYAELEAFRSDSNSPRSMQVLALVQQLINLKKNSNELPTTLNVHSLE